MSDPAAVIRDWMNLVLKEAGLSPRSWANAAGVAPSTVQRAIKPDYQFITSSRTLAKLASVANRSPPEIGRTRDAQLVPRFLSVRFRAQAGHWYETDVDSQVAPREHAYPVAPDPRYAEWPQWLEEIVGDSVNERMAPGAFAHVVDAIEMGYEPRADDYVVVERRRDGGRLRERSVKQVVLQGDRVELWPRSTNPRWSEPLNLHAGVREGEDFEVEIVGLVIGAYSPF